MPESHDSLLKKNLEYNYIIGDKIRTLRLQNGRSQSDVADRLGMTYQQVQKYENGKTRIPAFIIPVLTDFFDTSCHDFFVQADEAVNKALDRRPIHDEIDKICCMLRETEDMTFVKRTRGVIKAMVNEFIKDKAD